MRRETRLTPGTFGTARVNGTQDRFDGFVNGHGEFTYWNGSAARVAIAFSDFRPRDLVDPKSTHRDALAQILWEAINEPAERQVISPKQANAAATAIRQFLGLR